MFCVLFVTACASKSKDKDAKTDATASTDAVDPAATAEGADGAVALPPVEDVAATTAPATPPADGAAPAAPEFKETGAPAAAAGTTAPATPGGDTLPPVADTNSDMKDSKMTTAATPSDSATAAPVSAAASTATSGGTPGNYTYKVKSGQTLMQVAYDVYGDLYQWKKVLEMNKDKVSDPNKLTVGTELSVDQSPMSDAHDKNGDPYLIKKGHTLRVISSDIYGMDTKWKRLWENNSRLIKDPNKIYAGFYLYYIMTEQDKIEKQQQKGTTVDPQPLSSQPKENDRKVSSVPPAVKGG